MRAPLLPLQVEELVRRALVQWGTMLWHEKLTQLQWDPEVVAFLTDRVRGPGSLHSAPWIRGGGLPDRPGERACLTALSTLDQRWWPS